MTDRPRETISAEEAPELHNAEQDDELEQAQTVAGEARYKDAEASPLDSVRNDEPGEVMGDTSQDLIDKMRAMEQSGNIDMGAYRGEPNMDDRSEEAPELHNAEQDDELEQAQTVAGEARYKDAEASPLDSVRNDEPGEVMGDTSQDLIDKMRAMEQSGNIDMGAYRGEPNMDD